MKKLLVMLFVLVACAASAHAQNNHGLDHWPPTEEGWVQCLDRTQPGRYYIPAKWLTERAKNRELPPNVEVRGHPGGCEEVELPDRLTRGLGRGVIRVAEGTPWMYDKNTGEPLGDYRCRNKRFRGILFPAIEAQEGPPGPPGPQGPAGPQGPPGQDGIHCWDSDEDGVNDPEEDVDGNGVFNSADCREKCEQWNTRGFFLHHKWEKCPNEEARVIDRGLNGWVIPAAAVLGAATGGLAAPVLCVTVESATAIGALSGVALAGATNVIVEDLPAPTKTLSDIMKE